jgi:hypothetical protein
MAQYIPVRAVGLIRSQWQLIRFAMSRFPYVWTHTVYSAVLGFWPVELPNGRLGASHWCSDRVIFSLLLSATVNTVDLVTHKFQENQHPPLSTSPHPVGPAASSTNSSTGQNHTLQYIWRAIISPTNKSYILGVVFFNDVHYFTISLASLALALFVAVIFKTAVYGGGGISHKTSFDFRYKCFR